MILQYLLSFDPGLNPFYREKPKSTVEARPRPTTSTSVERLVNPRSDANPEAEVTVLKRREDGGNVVDRAILGALRIGGIGDLHERDDATSPFVGVCLAGWAYWPHR